jgi:hypothetical protein
VSPRRHANGDEAPPVAGHHPRRTAATRRAATRDQRRAMTGGGADRTRRRPCGGTAPVTRLRWKACSRVSKRSRDRQRRAWGALASGHRC